MRKFSAKQKVAVALGTGAMVVAGAGAAVAYWTSSGSGSGSATTGTSATVTVNQTSTVSGLYPGGPAVPLSGNFDNSNSGAVKVGSVTATLGTLPTGCVAGDFTIGGTADVNAEIPHGTGVGTWTGLTIAMNDTAANQDACKSQTIPITYAVSAAS